MEFEELEKKINTLPEDVQRAVASTDVFKIIEKIGEQHKIHVDELGELIEETTLVMLGVTHPSEFVKNLAQRMGIDKERARTIAEDVNKEVFHPIRESLKKIHSLSKEETSASPTPPPQQQEETYQVPRPQRKIPVRHEIKKGAGAEVEPTGEIPQSGEQIKKDAGVAPSEAGTASDEKKNPEALIITPKTQHPFDPRGEEGAESKGNEGDGFSIPERLRGITASAPPEITVTKKIPVEGGVSPKEEKDTPPLNLPISPLREPREENKPPVRGDAEKTPGFSTDNAPGAFSNGVEKKVPQLETVESGGVQKIPINPIKNRDESLTQPKKILPEDTSSHKQQSIVSQEVKKGGGGEEYKNSEEQTPHKNPAQEETPTGERPKGPSLPHEEKPTQGGGQQEKENTPKNNEESNKKGYAADPYREPIE